MPSTWWLNTDCQPHGLKSNSVDDFKQNGSYLRANIETGSYLLMCQLTVEHLFPEKCDYLVNLLSKWKIDVLVPSDNKQASKCHISGCHLVASQHHPKHGLVTFVRQDLCNSYSIDLNSSTLHAITTRISELMLTNIYKPPNVVWLISVLPNHSHPSRWVRDFNSHYISWGYEDNATDEQIP